MFTILERWLALAVTVKCSMLMFPWGAGVLQLNLQKNGGLPAKTEDHSDSSLPGLQPGMQEVFTECCRTDGWMR